MKNRSIYNIILKKNSSKFGRIIILTGARQTGKTTLVFQKFQDYKYISLEDPVLSSSYKKLSAAQWKQSFPKAILDEVQKEPQLIESIKAVYDQYSDTEYMLLGSSQILLLKKVRETLAGRCQIVEMYPLTLPEMLTDGWDSEIKPSYFQDLISGNIYEPLPFLLDDLHPQKQKAFDFYLQNGLYPAITDDWLTAEEKKDWLKNYIKTYLERDIRDLAEIRHLEPFIKVQKLIALSTAQITNYSRIAVEAGVSAKTVQRFFEYMNISYQILILQSWNRNQKKRLVKSPKIHYLDVGILRAILQKNDALNGHEFESAIVSEIYKQCRTMDKDFSYYHFRTSDGREIDLLIETEKGYYAIEIKNAKKVRNVDAKHFKGLEEILDKPIIKKIIISNDLEHNTFNSDVLAMPAVQFLT